MNHHGVRHEWVPLCSQHVCYCMCLCTYNKCDGGYTDMCMCTYTTCDAVNICTFVCTLVSQTLS